MGSDLEEVKRRLDSMTLELQDNDAMLKGTVSSLHTSIAQGLENLANQDQFLAQVSSGLLSKADTRDEIMRDIIHQIQDRFSVQADMISASTGKVDTFESRLTQLEKSLSGGHQMPRDHHGHAAPTHHSPPGDTFSHAPIYPGGTAPVQHSPLGDAFGRAPLIPPANTIPWQHLAQQMTV